MLGNGGIDLNDENYVNHGSYDLLWSVIGSGVDYGGGNDVGCDWCDDWWAG